MKIAVACATIGVVHRGGELQLTQMMQKLAERGHQTTVFTGGAVPAPGGARVRPLATLRRHARRFSDRSKVGIAIGQLDRWQFALRAYAHLAAERPDVVIPVDPPIHERLAGLMRTRWGTRMVSFGLGGPDHDAMRLAAAPDLFVVSSPRAQRLAQQHAQQRVAVIPPGVDLRHFSPDGERAQLDLPRPIVGVFGALIACKRIELAIEAVRRTSGSLLVVGSGPERGRILAAGAALASRFRLVDELSAAEVPRWMRAIDVLCFPADEAETFGMVVIEAMACGKPVVASDDEVRRWMVGDAGELCDPTDSALLARALERAASSQYPGVERARRFSWEAAALRLDEELQAL